MNSYSSIVSPEFVQTKRLEEECKKIKEQLENKKHDEEKIDLVCSKIYSRFNETICTEGKSKFEMELSIESRFKSKIRDKLRLDFYKAGWTINNIKIKHIGFGFNPVYEISFNVRSNLLIYNSFWNRLKRKVIDWFT
jgi:hypothetical protein